MAPGTNQAPVYGTTFTHIPPVRPNVSIVGQSVNVTSQRVFNGASSYIPPQVQTTNVVKRQSIVNFTGQNPVVSTPVTTNIVQPPAVQNQIIQKPLVQQSVGQQPLVIRSQIQPQLVQQPLVQSQIQTVRPAQVPIQQIIRQGPPIPIQQNPIIGSQRAFVLSQPQNVQRVVVSQG